MDTSSSSQSSSQPRRDIVVLGLGRGGGRVVAHLARHCHFPNLCAVAADTSAADLESLPVDRTLILGEGWSNDEGCGGDLTRGERAASAAVESFHRLLDGAALLVGVAGLGGGTGAGACSVLARFARKAKLPSLYVVTMPFSFEGEWHRRNAERALEQIRAVADAVIVVPNDQLFHSLAADTSAAKAFSLADSLLAEGIAGLARIFTARGLIPAGLDNVKAILAKRKSASILGIGRAEEGEGFRKALENFLSCPLVGGRKTLEGIDSAVLALLGGADLSIQEIREGLEEFQALFPKHARVEVGAYIDEHMEGRIQLTALMCRYENEVHQPSLPLGGDIRKTPAKSGGKARRKKTGDDGQYQLPLTEQTLGIFKPSSPTTENGENLDIPTFQRRGRTIDTGE